MKARCKVRFKFTTLDLPYYIGGICDPLIKLMEIEKNLPSHIKKSQYIKERGSTKVAAEYFIGYDDSNLPKQEGSLAKFVGRDPHEELLEKDIELVENLLKKKYSIGKNQNDKIMHQIILEDNKLIKA